MKYQSIESFEKHIKQSFPEHLSRCYLIVASHEEDRKKLMDRVVALFEKREPSLGKERFSLAEHSLSHAMALFETQDLFATETCYVVDNLEKARSIELEKLAHFLLNPSPSTLLVLGASGIKSLNAFYAQVKNELIVLDLTEEKPWERQRRIVDWVVHRAQRYDKRVTYEAASYLVEMLGTDMALLEQELHKLFCYVGEKNTIDIEDIKAVSSARDLITSWQVAEALVWQDKPLHTGLTSDLNALIPLLGQIRYQLELGFQLAFLSQKKASVNEIGSHFPSLRPNQLEKYMGYARQRPVSYFKEGLQLLFDLEIKLKSSSLDPSVHWDIFYSKFTLLKLYEMV